jgi:hypothetical protein
VSDKSQDAVAVITGIAGCCARHFEWPRRRAAEKGNELAAATHSITSSA